MAHHIVSRRLASAGAAGHEERRRLSSRGGGAAPLHWSSLLGVVSLSCLIVLTVTGVILLLFYEPSGDTVRYSGSYAPMEGVPVSRAYASTLHLSLEVRGGLLVRQAHHWAALVLPASLMLQMLSIFFTGRFRRPRHWSWVLLCLTFFLALAAGWSGYALPDDQLAGTGLRIFEGILVGIPVVGPRATFVIFGGEFPGSIIERLYWLHVGVIPVLLVVVLALRLLLAARRRPARLSSRGHTERNVAGLPAGVVAVRSVGLFLITSGVLVLMAGLLTISPVWLHGPSSTADASSGSQPDWYMGFLDGALRLVPSGWEVELLGGTVPIGLLVAQGLVGAFLGVVLLWPFLEARVTGDRADHHLLDRPRMCPTRTALGVAGIVFYGSLWTAGATDLIATQLNVSFERQVVALRIVVVFGPLVAIYFTRQISLALVAQERDEALHGVATGRIMRSPQGGYTEIHKPVAGDHRALSSGDAA
ncbi:MAG: cytochrome b N-terminal domain-containing protein [Actinomycetota bacterium]|nr:cytochrome b N-terminal domain-containing protein [Actinomycetota bacterium]